MLQLQGLESGCVVTLYVNEFRLEPVVLEFDACRRLHSAWRRFCAHEAGEHPSEYRCF